MIGSDLEERGREWEREVKKEKVSIVQMLCSVFEEQVQVTQL